MHRLVLIVCLASTGAAAQGIYRCEDASGRRIFADQPCSEFNALPLPSEGDALPPRAAVEPSPRKDIDLSPPIEAQGCPGSDPAALAQALSKAVGAGNLNAIAGLFHWPAAGRGTANRVFGRAETLIQQGPIAVEQYQPAADDTWLWAGLPPPPPQTSLPHLQVFRVDPPRQLLAEYRLITHAGCVWILPD